MNIIHNITLFAYRKGKVQSIEYIYHNNSNYQSLICRRRTW